MSIVASPAEAASPVGAANAGTFASSGASLPAGVPSPPGMTRPGMPGFRLGSVPSEPAIGPSGPPSASKGNGWGVQSTPNPEYPNGTLNSVSCTSASACTAVGDYFNSSGVWVALAEVWNGANWALQSTPNPTGASSSYLYGVSCTSASACTAVGFYINNSYNDATLAEVWNGATWRVQSTPNPTGARSSYLSAVSCRSASACTAVGTDTNSLGYVLTLAEVWNGATWRVQSTPNPTGALRSYLSAVSCPSATGCIAVGSFQTSALDEVTLAEVWDGSTWALQSTPNPTGATSSYLYGVSCPGATGCIAVGSAQTSLLDR